MGRSAHSRQTARSMRSGSSGSRARAAFRSSSRRWPLHAMSGQPAGRGGRLRGSRLPAGRAAGRRPILVAVLSTATVFGLLGAIVLNAPGWPLVREAFLNGRYVAEAWPRQVAAVAVNVQLFLLAEILILPFALMIDVNRIRRRIGIVFQAFNLFPHMRVLDNVTLGPRKVLGCPGRKLRHGRWTSWSGSAWPTSATSSRTACPAGS